MPKLAPVTIGKCNQVSSMNFKIHEPLLSLCAMWFIKCKLSYQILQKPYDGYSAVNKYNNTAQNCNFKEKLRFMYLTLLEVYKD